MGEFFIMVYLVSAICSVAGLTVHNDVSPGKYHWTRPFAGALWPILAVIGVYMAWVKRND